MIEQVVSRGSESMLRTFADRELPSNCHVQSAGRAAQLLALHAAAFESQMVRTTDRRTLASNYNECLGCDWTAPRVLYAFVLL